MTTIRRSTANNNNNNNKNRIGNAPITNQIESRENYNRQYNTIQYNQRGKSNQIQQITNRAEENLRDVRRSGLRFGN